MAAFILLAQTPFSPLDTVPLVPLALALANLLCRPANVLLTRVVVFEQLLANGGYVGHYGVPDQWEYIRDIFTQLLHFLRHGPDVIPRHVRRF